MWRWLCVSQCKFNNYCLFDQIISHAFLRHVYFLGISAVLSWMSALCWSTVVCSNRHTSLAERFRQHVTSGTPRHIRFMKSCLKQCVAVYYICHLRHTHLRLFCVSGGVKCLNDIIICLRGWIYMRLHALPDASPASARCVYRFCPMRLQVLPDASIGIAPYFCTYSPMRLHGV